MDIDTLPVQIVAYRAYTDTINTPTQQWLRITNAAKMRNVKQHTVRNWIQLGFIVPLVMDGVHYITLEDLDKYIESRKSHQMSGSRKYRSKGMAHL